MLNSTQKQLYNYIQSKCDQYTKHHQHTEISKVSSNALYPKKKKK